ncbi:hypothetical protein K504DRAFT_377897 [Pleomassaria siparia CBS 279.74]|uniref:EH domain-containing protein n=1 Tax=Pleomassaria siparia CBS 279.74 TaxID=1314801 RepID=A0A6G1KB21_9PLEO|nr:hypothetical protein K504DRAFT_377897 [Pleomassaria siparia CBS 279.74]
MTSACNTQYNVRDAALHGASSAFSKPPVKPQPPANTYTGGNNGALIAATKAGTGTPRAGTPGTASLLRHDMTGGSSRSASRSNALPVQVRGSRSSSSSTLGVPEDPYAGRTPSPSNIAAKLAAARYSPRKPLSHLSPMSIVSERDTTERDVLPPTGSVGNVLARLDTKQPSQQPRPRTRRVNSTGTLSTTANTLRKPVKGDEPTDDTPIPPTTSLVHMFEQNRPKTPPKRTTAPTSVSQGVPPHVRSPKPRRTFAMPPEPKEEPLRRIKSHTPPPVKPKPRVEIMTAAVDRPRDQSNFSMLRKDSMGIPPNRQKPAQLAAIKTSSSRPTPPAQRGSRKTRAQSQDLARPASSHARVSTSMDSNENPSSPSFFSAHEEQEEDKPKPSLPPPRRSGRPKAEAAPQSEARPQTSYTPNPSQIKSTLDPPERLLRRRSASATGTSPPNTLYHSNYQRESVKAIAKHLTGESLSNAIVGAALASSRNASPAPPMTATPPLPTRKQHHHLHSPFHPTRSPSPPKPTGKMRSTMRKEKSSSSDEDEGERYKKKGTRIMGMRRKHPNKHHEGTRKRWRDAITERERKRYEGVWAANKGLCIPPPARSQDTDSTQDVLNLVTKDIWTRSRLPDHELEEVWSLVDSRGVGSLRREEFVVGLWLIDQRLKGRKLPIRVTESVWESVRGVGVRVKIVANK